MRRHRTTCAIRVLLSVFTLLFFVSCATTSETKHFPKFPRKHGPSVTEPSKGSSPEVNIPKRRASEQLVEKGIVAMNDNKKDQAEHFFHEAINVDASNGVAYFYLAKLLAEHEREDEALGFLDKAESLIEEDDEYWHEQIAALRGIITGETPAKNEEENYY